ncbi:MAG: F0F1 ATP synthase subunit B [Gammaproteobacteria bacterium]
MNLTLVGQMLTFAIFVWFTMKYVWPPLTAAMDERQKKIADGLAAAERGEHELVLAQEKATERLREAHQRASVIVEEAERQKSTIIEQAQIKAREEGQRLLAAAKADIETEKNNARRELQQYISQLVIECSEKIIGKSIDAAANDALINKLITEIE